MKKFLMLMTMIFLLVFTFTISSQATLNQKTEEAMITATIEQMPGITDVAQQFAITPNMDTANNAIKKNAIAVSLSGNNQFAETKNAEGFYNGAPEVTNIIKMRMRPS